jgi:hypothetical protein
LRLCSLWYNISRILVVAFVPPPGLKYNSLKTHPFRIPCGKKRSPGQNKTGKHVSHDCLTG